jgi:hypothetical protein
MLKEVMIGSGGILLAAAMVASSVAPGPDTAAPMAAQPVVVVPPPVQQAAPSPAQPVFADESGDMEFGAPMIEAVPVEDAASDPTTLTADPDTAEASGGRQFYAQPGRPYPIPR